MLTSFDHLTILVKDLDAAVQSYQRLFGIAPSWRGVHPDLGTHSALFGLCNALIELVGPIDGAPEATGMRELLEARDEGLYAVAWGTPDADACSDSLRARGLRATLPQPGQARDASGHLRSYRTIDLSPRMTRGLSVYVVERSDSAALRSAAPASDGVFALDHVVIRTANIDAAIALYGEGLGIRLALDRMFGDVRMLFFRVGGVTLEVVEDRTLGATDVFYGATYRVRDLDATHARMRASGFRVDETRAGIKPNTRVYSVKDGTCGVPTLILRDPGRDGA